MSNKWMVVLEQPKRDSEGNIVGNPVREIIATDLPNKGVAIRIAQGLGTGEGGPLPDGMHTIVCRQHDYGEAELNKVMALRD